jgi:hypothetical protein
MNWEPPLSWCIVDCDGSACGSGLHVGRHTHQVQSSPWYVDTPVARAYVENGRVTYSAVGEQ